MEEKIWYATTDELKLCGLLANVKKNDKIVVLCHGLNSNKDELNSYIALARELNKQEYNTFRFDFRGHGESQGEDKEMTITKEIEDVKQTLAMLEQMGYTEFILIGASFSGGVIALFNQINRNIIGKIIWYGALNYEYLKIPDYFSKENKEIAEKKGYATITSKRSGKTFRLGKQLFRELEEYKPLEQVIKSHIPILLVHGTADTIIPYQSSIEAHQKSKCTTLEIIEKGSHGFSENKEMLQEAVNKTITYIKKILQF